ncbi:MAG: hypothetical protein JXA30_07280 [Deltaproteobacteria bacterium]|nr:hypothetical protein [Deltaproteobacteria bacterium]
MKSSVLWIAVAALTFIECESSSVPADGSTTSSVDGGGGGGMNSGGNGGGSGGGSGVVPVDSGGVPDGSRVGTGPGEAGIAGTEPIAGAGAIGGVGASGGASATGGVGATGGSAGAAAGAAGGEAGTGGGGTDETRGCDDTTLLEVPSDTSVRGPWPVGEITVSFGSLSAVDVMYPAQPGSETGKSPILFDVRTTLPPAEAAKIPDARASHVSVDTYADLPIDADHGPYPAVILMHGTASFRIASATTQAHWASRGFIVMAADHPNLCLKDMIALCATVIPLSPLTLSTDIDAEIAALQNPSGSLSFLAGHVDTTRIALAGHSAGAYAVAQYSNKPNVQMVILLSGTMPVAPSVSLKSVLFVSGLDDLVLPYEFGIGLGTILYGGPQMLAYEGSPTPKRILGITGGGHLAVTDLCQTNANGETPMDVMLDPTVGVGCVGILPLLFDCGTINWKTGVDIVSDITVAALEETLHCKDRSSAISSIASRHPEVGDLRESL